jgi:ComF family protein
MFNIKNTIEIFAGSILDVIYPPLCLCCENLLVGGDKHVCVSCWESLKRVETDLPLFLQTRDKLLAGGVVDDLVSLYVFEKEGGFQKIIHAVKYSGTSSLGIDLGRRLGQNLKTHKTIADTLVPIPLHKRKLRERGYNQSEFIARGLSDVTGIPVNANYVERAKFTQTQTTLSMEERRMNMERAFTCVSSEVEGKVIVLVDDVITTGATITSCAHMLKERGATRVIATSVALAS